jgi:hypothetical protein
MSTRRLEWLRMTRTPRAIALGGTYLFFGLLGPVTAKYLQQIVNRVQSGVQVIVAHPTPKDGIANYISQISRTGLIVVIVITAVTAYTLGTLAAWYETALPLGAPPQGRCLPACSAARSTSPSPSRSPPQQPRWPAAASMARSTLGTVSPASLGPVTYLTDRGR